MVGATHDQIDACARRDQIEPIGVLIQPLNETTHVSQLDQIESIEVLIIHQPRPISYKLC
jgi:hypothetical protein